MQLGVVVLCVAFVGCGGDGLPPPVPVSGTVNYKNKPVEGATVTFLSQNSEEGGRSASGKTGKDGTFKLTTVNTGDGAPPGEYTVTIDKSKSKFDDSAMDADEGNFGADYGRMMDAAARGDMSRVMKNELPSQYGNPANSGLKRTVVKGEENNFVFDLE